jgi:UDP-glucose 4-epimerase
MERILVTGGAGYVGSTCCRQLVKRGFSVEVLDDLSTGHAEAVPDGVKLNQFNLGDRDTLNSVLAGKRFDVVFHFAAKALIPESVVNPGPFFDANVGASIAMMETLRQHGIRKFVFSSSAAVYGLPKSVPIEEDHGQEPVNAYGESKLSLERILKWYAAAYGWSVVAFRYFNACGGDKRWGERHEPETHILPLLLETASGRRECFEIYGTDYPTPDGTCLRDYVHVLDIAEAHLLALEKMDLPGFHAYNIGTGTSHSVREICRVAEEVTSKKIKIRHAARRLGDPAVLCASPKKLMHEFGWVPSHSDIREVIGGAWEWEQEQCKRALAQQSF